MSDIRAGRLNAAELADNFSDLHPPLSQLQAAVESARCLFCFDAPCMEACPTGIDVPGFIRKIASGNTRGAAVDILSENIMGGTCANVCPVEELCEAVCVKNTAEEKPVEIGSLQRFATDALFASGVQPFERWPESGKTVAVVGAGPAGLSCAHRLACYGHQVVAFEAADKGGGLNEYGIAAYKMNDQRAARELEFIVGIGGIEIRAGQALGREISLPDLQQDFDAVFLGLGLGDGNNLGLENEDMDGVLDATGFIAKLRQQELSSMAVGRHVVVIGGGNTAIDIAVQTRKLGAEEVTLVYRRGPEEMSATVYEQNLAQCNGVLIRTFAMPIGLIGDDNGLTAVEFEGTQNDQQGRLGRSGKRFTLQADMMFKAIGQRFDPGPLGSLDQRPDMLDGRITVDDHCKTSLDGVYAGGDCVAGLDLTVAAVQDGKVAAEAIHRQLTEG
jgi:dihydropyrimidine dehydrogenase (NAD+) subunit PreT